MDKKTIEKLRSDIRHYDEDDFDIYSRDAGWEPWMDIELQKIRDERGVEIGGDPEEWELDLITKKQEQIFNEAHESFYDEYMAQKQ